MGDDTLWTFSGQGKLIRFMQMGSARASVLKNGVIHLIVPRIRIFGRKLLLFSQAPGRLGKGNTTAHP